MNAPSPDIDITIEHPAWHEHGPALEPLLRAAIEATLKVDVLPAALCGKQLELSILLTGDEQIQILNRDYRQKDKPTNVLSFPLFDEDAPETEDCVALGDIVVAYETIRREAEEQEKSFNDHLSHMAVHSTLHLLGFDHMEDDEAEEMESLEIQILGKMGIENPYNDANFMR